jgi:surfeit locus 1 family protein
MGTRVFRPRLWSVIVTLTCAAGFSALGNWQLDRARQKRERVASYAVRQQAPAIQDERALRAEGEDLLWRRVRLHGWFEAERQVLLDNQVLGGRAGYHVLTPFRVAPAVAVLVDRGWLAAPSREAIPATEPPSGDVVLAGSIAPPPASGIRLGGADAIERLGRGFVRVQYLDVERLRDVVGIELSPWLVYSDAATGGLQPVRPGPVDRGERHTAYAVQWFSFAVIAGALFLILNWRRVDRT